MATHTPLCMQTISQIRLHPSHPPQAPTTIPLSILDNTVSNFPCSSAIWFFDCPPSLSTSKPGHPPLFLSTPTIASLTASLTQTLTLYPHWAGQLSLRTHDPNCGHTHRFGCIQISYDSLHDPGIELITAHASTTLSSLVPSASARATYFQGWDTSSGSLQEFFPATELALKNTKDTPGAPAVIVQLTTFTCGGLAIAVKIAHVLADAQSLSSFMHDWAHIHREGLEERMRHPVPLYAPGMLDAAAAGELDGTADPALVAEARALPLHRYDWWASDKGRPSYLAERTRVPPELDPDIERSEGVAMPWDEWDMSREVAHRLLHFSGREVEGIWEAAVAEDHGTCLSRHDAILAFVWGLINRAREMDNDERTVYLNLTLGVRARVEPKLPESFLGSPIILANISMTGIEASDPASLPLMAHNIRSTVAKFQPKAVAAVLHDMAHEISPQRLWQAFLGKRNIIVTSWAHQRMYEVDFGTRVPPRFVSAVLPDLDGIVEIMEAAPTPDKTGIEINGKHWCNDGVDVDLHLERSTMDRLLADSLLRKYCK